MLKAKSLIEKLENAHKQLRIIKSIFKETSNYYLDISNFLNKQSQKFKSNLDIFEIVTNFLSINQEASSSKAKMFFNKSEKFGICHKSLKLLGNNLKHWISKGKAEVDSEIKKNKNIKDGKLTYKEENKLFKDIHEDISKKIKETMKYIADELTCFIQHLCIDDDNYIYDTSAIIDQVYYYKGLIQETFSNKNYCELEDYSDYNKSIDISKAKLANKIKAKELFKSNKPIDQIKEVKKEVCNNSSSIICNNKKNKNPIEIKHELINENNTSSANLTYKRSASFNLIHPKDLDNYLYKEVGSLDNESFKHCNISNNVSSNDLQSFNYKGIKQK